MTQNDFAFACVLLADRQRLIAAGKLQRWDVVKWTATINVALAAAALGFKARETHAGYEFFVSAAIVAAAGWGLMLYYNLRLKRSRDHSLITERYLDKNGIDYSVISGGPPTVAGFCYDREELIVFSLFQLLSIVPTLVVWKLGQ
jgi:hypothetical protein